MADERNEKRTPVRVHDSDVSRVLERALELDQLKSQYVSAERLRAIALEAGISTESIDAALAELEAGTQVAASRLEAAEPDERKGWFKSLFAKPKWTKWTKVAAWLALPVGAAVGLSIMQTDPLYSGLFLDSLIRTIVIASGGVLLALQPNTARSRPIAIALVLYWFGFVLGGSMLEDHGRIPTDVMIRIAIVSCSMSLLVGGAIALIRSVGRRGGESRTPPSSGSKSPATRMAPVPMEAAPDLGDRLGYARVVGDFLRDVMRGVAGERRAGQEG
jgi:hypothetical protein